MPSPSAFRPKPPPVATVSAASIVLGTPTASTAGVKNPDATDPITGITGPDTTIPGTTIPGTPVFGPASPDATSPNATTPNATTPNVSISAVTGPGGTTPGAFPAAPSGRPEPASIAGTRPSRGKRVRSAATGVCAVALVAAVIPLVALQVPDAIAWAVPPSLAGAGTNTLVNLLRASGLALPAMAAAASVAALAVRWLRAGPVLLAGLLVIAGADVLGDTEPSISAIGADRALHGAGAGIAMIAVAAIVADRPRLARRSLAGWWAAFTVAGLAAAPALMKYRLSKGDWHAALHPYPWLTGAALVLAALYALVAEGAPTTAARTAFPATERAQLALLTAPVGGICAVAVAATYRGDKAVVAAAIAAAVALIGITAVTARAGTAARFAMVCSVTGFTVAPTAGVVTVLGQPTAESGAAALAAALCGAALAMSIRRVRAVTATGLFLAAAGFGALYLTGPGSPLPRSVPLAGGWADPRSYVLALVCVPLAGGLGAALTAALRGTRGAASGTAGAMAGAVLLLTGVVAGFLAAGAMQVNALTGVRSAPGVQHALVTAADRWILVAAAAAAVFALVMTFVTRWRVIISPSRKAAQADAGELGEVPADAPGRRAGRRPDRE